MPRSRFNCCTLSKIWLRSLRVDAYRRLVQEEQAAGNAAAGADVHPALHPAGVFLHRLVGALGQGNDMQYIVNRRSLSCLPCSP